MTNRETTTNILQIDREAAALIAEECNPEVEFLPELYRDGKIDSSPLVQAFARHRQNTIPDTHDERTAIVAWLRYSALAPGLTRELRKILANEIARGDHPTQQDKSDATG